MGPGTLLRPRLLVHPGAAEGGSVPLGPALGLDLAASCSFMPPRRPLGSHSAVSDFPVPGISPPRHDHFLLFLRVCTSTHTHPHPPTRRHTDAHIRKLALLE